MSLIRRSLKSKTHLLTTGFVLPVIQKQSHVEKTPSFVKQLHIACLAAGLFAMMSSTAFAQSSLTISGWVIPEQQAAGLNVYRNNASLFSDINLFWYDVGTSATDRSGNIQQRDSYSDAVVQEIHARGDKCVPAISDRYIDTFPRQINAIFSNATARQNLINKLVNTAVAKSFDGWELDFENGDEAGKALYTNFVRDLAAALKAKGKILDIDIGAFEDSTHESYWIMDIAGLKTISDVRYFKILAYDKCLRPEYRHSFANTVDIPPIGEIDWVDACINYMVVNKGLPKEKVLLGIPNYSWTWADINSQGYELQRRYTYTEITARTQTIVWNPSIAESTATWENGSYFAYVSDAKSVKERLKKVRQYGLKGAAFFWLGNEDSNIYPQTSSFVNEVNQGPSEISLNDISVTEGNEGTINAHFTVSLSAPNTQNVTTHYATANGGAKAGSDYTASSGDLTFAPGETSKTINVPVKGDLLDEADETFYVILSSPTNATITKGRGIGTIVDDDATPTISIDDLSVKEYNSGQTTAVFPLHLSAPSGQVVQVRYSTASGTATPDSDYVEALLTNVAFNVGSTVAYARVLINGDTLNEPNETFYVNLARAQNATIARFQAQGTILNDDAAPALSINDVSVTEGDAGTKTLTFTVSLSKPSGQSVSVNYATSDGVARSTSDYVAKTGALNFAAGQTSKTVSVVINGDTTVEADETLYVLLSGAVNASVGKARGVGTITNDDASG